jgi:hypothetical protein
VTFEDGDNRAMATDRTDVMLRVFAAINRRDVGQQAVGKFWRDWVGSWERLSCEAEDGVEVPPHYVVLVNHITGRGAGRGIEVDARGGHAWEVVAERCGA